MVGVALSVILPTFDATAQQENDQPPSEPVSIRGGEHGDYSRIVFDWETAVPYTVSAGPGRLVVSFDEVRDADYRLVNPAILENIATLEQISGSGQPLRIAITISENTRIRDFNLGPKLVVDVLDDPAQPGPAIADTAEALDPDSSDAPAQAGEQASETGARQASDDAEDAAESADLTSTADTPASEPATEGEVSPEQEEAEQADLTDQAVGDQPTDSDELEPAQTAADRSDETDVGENQEQDEAASPTAAPSAGEPSEQLVADLPSQQAIQEDVNSSEAAEGSPTADGSSDPTSTQTANVRTEDGQDGPAGEATATSAESEQAAPAGQQGEASTDSLVAEIADGETNPDTEVPAADQSAQDTTDSDTRLIDQLAPSTDGQESGQEAAETVAASPTGENGAIEDDAVDALAVIEKEIEQAEGAQAESQQTAALEPAPPTDEIEIAEPAPQAVPAGRLETDLVQQQAVFDPGVASLLSVFRRGDALWVVIGAETPLDPTVLAAQGSVGFGPAEIAAADGGAALRYVVDPALHPTVELDGTRWIVRLIDEPQAHSRLVEVVPQPEFPLGPRVLVEAEGVQGLVRVADPEVGDVLVVAPLQVPTMGLARERRFVEVRLLPSIQGLVAELLADSVTMRIVRQGVEITTSDGLILSPLGDRRASTVNTFGAPIPDSLLRIGDWQGPPAQFNKRRQALQRNVAVADDENLARARLDLARFYVSHGYGSEASGLLGLMRTADESLPDRPDFRALDGVAKLLVGDTQEALDAFDHAELRDREEIALWRAATHADLADWPAANEDFALARPLLAAYPDPFADYFYFRAGRAALEMEEFDALGAMIDLLSSTTDQASDEWAMTDYFRGMIALETGDLAEAEASLKRAARSDDPKIHILASLALVDQGTARGTLTAEQAADELESLRFAWRGDEIEFDISEKLGDKYWEIGRYHDAVSNWQRAVDNFPDHMPAIDLGEAIPGRLADLIVQPRADGGLNPLRASALYSEFKNLLPDGERGIEVALSVVDKLVSIDLLAQASQMLEELTRNRLQGETAVRTALREAGLHLLQDKPDAAIKTLDWTEGVLAATGAPQDIESERRLLRADSLARLEQPEAALDVLSDQNSRLAAAARVNIAWKAGLWQQASQALADLIGQPPDGDEPMPQAQADTVINYGIALALADDGEGLTALAENFGPAIEATDRAAVFRILTRGEAPLQPIRDLAAVRRQTTEIELFRDFLDGYREAATTVAATEG